MNSDTSAQSVDVAEHAMNLILHVASESKRKESHDTFKVTTPLSSSPVESSEVAVLMS